MFNQALATSLRHVKTTHQIGEIGTKNVNIANVTSMAMLVQ